MIRFEFNVPTRFWVMFNRALPFVLVIKILCFYFFDLYRGMWRYTSISDLLNVIKATSISTLIVITLILFESRFEGYSRSVFIIDWCFTVFLISWFRLCVRFYFERFGVDMPVLKSNGQIRGVFSRRSLDVKKLLIIGAGDCGEKIYREIRDNDVLRYRVVGFLDDHLTKVGMKIHGIPVLSSINELKAIAKKVKADEVLIAIPSADSRQMRRIVSLCSESGIEFKTVPGMGELIDGRVSINIIRDVAYRDLLGREVINLDEEKIGAYLKDQSVLVTGAGGSIGSELCRQICRFGPEKIVLFERAESPLYEIEWELKQKYHDIKIEPILGDIQDIYQIDVVFDRFKPQTVFHAAAYKHVPMLELQPWKAIENNIKGTYNLINAANRFEIERFVFVSTDKAVRPTNVMGATKRVSEMLVQAQSSNGSSNTRFMIVRFGNVVGSVGSVVPLFKKQIKNGGPVTVTHPDVTRYFMTIPEACQLILQAGALGWS
jgi:FlaA1/EpsC-like NDP-sugar epimerase